MIQPVVRLEGKLCIFPGIPALFQKMLNGLTDYLPLPPECDRPKRIQIFTECVLLVLCAFTLVTLTTEIPDALNQ